MMKKFYKLMMVAAALTAAPLMSSCNDDDEVDYPEYTTSFVYLQQNDYLQGDKVCTITHNALTGLIGEVNMTFKAKLQRPATADVKVMLDTEVSEGLDKSKIQMSADHVTIKAGEVQSEEVNVTMSDFSFMADVETSANYMFQVVMKEIQTTAAKVQASQTYGTLPVAIYKEPISYDNLEQIGSAPAESEFDDRSSWTITLQPGVENGAGNLIDGNGGSDVAINGDGFWIQIDMGEEKTLAGIKTNHWGSYYAPTAIAMAISSDGKDWTSMGELGVSGGTQTIGLKVPMKARYLKYEILSCAIGRVDVTEFNIYIKK